MMARECAQQCFFRDATFDVRGAITRRPGTRHTQSSLTGDDAWNVMPVSVNVPETPIGGRKEFISMIVKNAWTVAVALRHAFRGL